MANRKGGESSEGAANDEIGCVVVLEINRAEQQAQAGWDEPREPFRTMREGPGEREATHSGVKAWENVNPGTPL